ncbi:hypothetical protein E3N88_20814 [Mikania micrantha]|uniref:Nudix hydrolase domain-containing protein n=1 Tax=Mikania micrantha TaxID=192012 RepID=A0A5N6NI40_9ASTR|nr:hypothetical protein E3N88_20814 [Mikania micrantha]
MLTIFCNLFIKRSTVQGNTRKINFCQLCGGPTKYEKPDGDEKERAICTICGKISYENPKMVVGCLIEHDNKVLLCKRKIQPSYGLWTLPAGYMEIGESATEGAIRETWEEAGAKVRVISPFAQLDIPLIGQSYLIFLAKLMTPHFSPGRESSECQLFAHEDIPYESLSFSSMLITLKLYIEDIKVGKPKFHYGLINKRTLKHTSDQSHNLVLLSSPAYPEGVFKCNACGSHGNGFSYHCRECQLDLHVVCASMPRSIDHEAHGHTINLCFRPPYETHGFKCDLCKQPGSNQWLYRCDSCDFDVHLNCATIRTTSRAIPPPSPPIQSYNSWIAPTTTVSRSVQSTRPNAFANNMAGHIIEGLVGSVTQEIIQYVFDGMGSSNN